MFDLHDSFLDVEQESSVVSEEIDLSLQPTGTSDAAYDAAAMVEVDELNFVIMCFSNDSEILWISTFRSECMWVSRYAMTRANSAQCAVHTTFGKNAKVLTNYGGYATLNNRIIQSPMA